MSPEAVKFLLVDDRPENLLAMEALLRRDGLEILKAQTGAEALELLLVHEFALALLDVQMPGMDGFELAELMRGTDRTRHVPIIFVTAVATDERRRFRGFEAGAVDYLLKPVDTQVLVNKVNVYFDLANRKLEVSRQRDALHESAGRLSEALRLLQAHRDNSPLAIVEFDPELRVTGWSEGAERLFGWRTAEIVGRRAGELSWLRGDAEDAPLRAADFSGPSARSMQVRRNRRSDGGIVECEWYNSALLSPAGTLVSISSQILDITERKRAEETQQLLIAELNHRVKNTLATVQAIAVHTLRHTTNPVDFSANFSGRLQSLSQAHSLLSNATWRGADLAELIHDQLRLGSADDTRVTASGPEVQLTPQMALHLALILHELGTNARKYGALATAQGRVTLGWTIDDGRLCLVWSEHGGHPVKAPTRRGFGTTLIEESAKAERGSARVSYRTEGVTWEIALSLPAAPAVERPLSLSAAPTVAQDEAERASMPDPAHRFAGRRCLVVEDEPLVALVISSTLEDAGAEAIETAATVDQALEKIATATFDAVILDGNLRGERVDAIAAALTRVDTPFLFVSGYGREGLPKAFGTAPVLAKPFTQDQLVDALDRIMPRAADVIRLRK